MAAGHCPACHAPLPQGATLCSICLRVGSSTPRRSVPLLDPSKGPQAFYERWPRALNCSPWWGPLLLTFGLALALILLSPITSIRLRSDWTWFLCLTAGAIFTLVVWATRRLRTFTQELATALCIPNSRFLHQRLVKCLSDRHMFAFASGAGLLNAALGFAYGLWPADLAGKLTCEQLLPRAAYQDFAQVDDM